MAVAVSDVAGDDEGSVGVGAGGAAEVGVGSEVDSAPAVGDGVGVGVGVAVGVGVGVGVGVAVGSAVVLGLGVGVAVDSAVVVGLGVSVPGVGVAVGVGVDVSRGVSSSASAVSSGVTTLRRGSEPSRGVGVVVTLGTYRRRAFGAGSARPPPDVVARVYRLRPGTGPTSPSRGSPNDGPPTAYSGMARIASPSVPRSSPRIGR